jgi:hypothetical protein
MVDFAKIIAATHVTSTVLGDGKEKYKKEITGTSPVGSFSANGYGLMGFLRHVTISIVFSYRAFLVRHEVLICWSLKVRLEKC